MPTSGSGTPARKPAAKKSGPTKAQALKALGVTQEDLDAAQEIRELRKIADDLAENHATEVEKQDAAREAAIRTLKEAGLSVPPELEFGPQSGENFVQNVWVEPSADAQRTLEDRPQPPTQEVHLPVPENQVWYARNARHMEVSYRLTRQNAQGAKRTRLNPRGQRGDLQKLEVGDLTDHELQTQVAYGLVEVIPEAEALEILRKQSTNQTVGIHTPSSILTNAKGEAIQQPVRTEQEFNSQGVVVANLRPVVEGEYGEVVVDRSGINRAPQQTQQYVGASPGGNPAIISDGFQAQAQQQANLGGLDPQAMAADALARRKDLEGPGAGTGRVAVIVEPTVRM